MDGPAPRLVALLGVARAMLSTLGPRDALSMLLAEFGWDATLQLLALLRGDEAAAAFGMCWEQLLLGPLARDLDSQTH